jgi:hypothetical protein
MTLRVLLLAAVCMPPCMLPPSSLASLFWGCGWVATTTAPMGKLVALTNQRGTNMRTSSGEPRATAAPGSSCCSNTYDEAERTAHGLGPEPAPVLVHLHKRQLADTLTLRYSLTLLQQCLDTLAWLSVTADVGCTYLVLHLPGLHVNISI